MVRARLLSVPRAAAWGAAQALLWALGWAVTEAAGIDFGRQYAVFGASGALVAAALGGLLLALLRRPMPEVAR